MSFFCSGGELKSSTGGGRRVVGRAGGVSPAAVESEGVLPAGGGGDVRAEACVVVFAETGMKAEVESCLVGVVARLAAGNTRDGSRTSGGVGMTTVDGRSITSL